MNNQPRIGSLFSGYGGLDKGVMDVLGGTLAWYADVCKFNTDGTVGHHEPHRSPCAIMAHHHPDVPNLGDVAAVKWTPDCPDCGEATAVYRRRVEGDPFNEWAGDPFYWCGPCDREWDVTIRLDDPESDRIPDPVDVLTGGSPCQDLSHAGKRKGMTEGTRSNLWVAMREAIAHLRPSLVVWENVRGAYSAAADSELEPCPGCVGDGGADVALRALGRVLGDLSDLGYDCRWHGLRAADIGAPHGRFRVFVVASARDAAGDHLWQHAELGGGREGGAQQQARGADRDSGTLLPTPAAYDGDRGGPQHPDKRKAGGHSVTLQDAVHGLLSTPRATRGGSNTETVGLLPTPRATDGTKGGPNQRGSSGDLMLPSAVTLIPTPLASDAGPRGGTTGFGLRDWSRASAKGEHQLLPTPTSMDSRASGGNPDTTGTHGTTLTDATARRPQEWGLYADAIARWEHLTRPAPPPTQPSKKGTPQLSPAFSEWLMGLPEGHVTGVPGLSRNDMLKALGNGVVPQQAEAALRFLLSIRAVAS